MRLGDAVTNARNATDRPRGLVLPISLSISLHIWPGGFQSSLDAPSEKPISLAPRTEPRDPKRRKDRPNLLAQRFRTTGAIRSSCQVATDLRLLALLLSSSRDSSASSSLRFTSSKHITSSTSPLCSLNSSFLFVAGIAPGHCYHPNSRSYLASSGHTDTLCLCFVLSTPHQPQGQPLFAFSDF